ncbi:MAG: anhydro-N-acetylmuramic acid kinase [Bacteroidota bacterium]|nr:anhydro-N-acetylmuramic acid kinase [Bacteroidota bacterium]MDP4231970.1 anhydro-N-acetylmuramic acid kinase [Bacteroidota bacterium]MDP4241323.1 anhydro-N-acetylmuramic acid kinase [Bacteroidota bacterium]MDP4287244.1 anhydro-N-acetylmuramic acid kinase [Bacteroidota bacterium]
MMAPLGTASERSESLYIGIMTGTSLDAIDVAVCRFENKIVELIHFHSSAWPKQIRTKLLTLASAEMVRMDDVATLHFALAKEYARSVNETLQEARLDARQICAIGLHGQTVRHLPAQGATLQLGNGSALAALTGIDVVSDFRAADVALGGQGAPLMPMFDYAFLKSDTLDRATLNIGGIANITWLPKGASIEDVIAFDTGPGNMLLDLTSRRYLDEPFDRNGEHAREGSINDHMLRELLDCAYFAMAPPKTTGREVFGEAFISPIMKSIGTREITVDDALATLTELTARSVAQSFRFVGSAGPFELVVSGGGIRNILLMERLSVNLPQAHIVSSDVFGISASAKEAIAFAFFAKAFLEELPIHLPRTTGAHSRATLGTLAKARREESLISQ